LHKKMRGLTLFFLTALTMHGCTGSGMYSDLDRKLAKGDCPAAVSLISAAQSEYGRNEALLYLLDAAMVYMQCGEYAAAQRHFHSAEDLADRLWTESITRNTLSLVTNDTVLAYAGEDFERVMIHLMSAIGYLQAGEPDEALVEARRLDTLLAIYNDKYDKKNRYKEDAFARYLSGILHEAAGELDEAFIDYRRAAEVYQSDYVAYGTATPRILLGDLRRIASAIYRSADIADVYPDGAIDTGYAPNGQDGMGNVVLIAFAGYAPRKVEDMVVLPTGQGPVGVAYPKMVVTPPSCGGGQLVVQSNDQLFEADLELVEDINRIADKNLDDRKGRILAKTVARAAAKQAAIYGASRSSSRQDDQETIETFLNLANILLLERADTRSWRTLPGRIYMTRLFVPAGAYKAKLQACGEMAGTWGPFSVDPGSTRYLFRDLRYPCQTNSHADNGFG
jgi:tetratricopeptide (TPR) repeat protein